MVAHQTAEEGGQEKALAHPTKKRYIKLRSHSLKNCLILKPKPSQIKPNPRASSSDQERAKLTIDIYDLNKTVRKKARLLEWMKADLQGYHLDDLSYRFMFL